MTFSSKIWVFCGLFTSSALFFTRFLEGTEAERVLPEAVSCTLLVYPMFCCMLRMVTMLDRKWCCCDELSILDVGFDDSFCSEILCSLFLTSWVGAIEFIKVYFVVSSKSPG